MHETVNIEIPTPTSASTNGTESDRLEVMTAPNYDLAKFCLKRILHNNTVRKSIALLGTFPDISTTDHSIILLEKQAFQESEVQTNQDKSDSDDQTEDAEKNTCRPSYFNSNLKVQMEFINNIYGSFRCVPSATPNVSATVVYPATEKHIEKYSLCQKFLINETPTLYDNVTLPYIKSSQFSLEWVYNILDHKQETERIVFEDNDPETGFILLPDLKWDGRNTDTLYLLAICHKHGIKSLRDLTAEHLPLLRNIRTRAAEAIEHKYNINPAQLRMYIHYQPSFYHLHVHINPVRNDAPGIWCEKSHMLDTVINNLELLSDYYQRCNLPFVLYEGNKLLECYEDKIPIRKAVKRASSNILEDSVDDIKKPKILKDC